MSEQNEWKRVLVTKIVPIHRSGWLGVWDSIMSAITKDERINVPMELEFSVWTNGNARLDIVHPQVESKDNE